MQTCIQYLDLTLPLADLRSVPQMPATCPAVGAGQVAGITQLKHALVDTRPKSMTYLAE